MSKTLTNKLVSLLLLIVMLFSFTGCSDFLKEIAAEKAADYANDVFNSFFKDPFTTVEKNSIVEVSFTDLIDEQKTFALDNLKNVSFSIKKTKVNEKRTEAEVTVAFKDVIDIFDDEDVINTVEGYEEYFSNCDSINYTLNFKIKRQENGWLFEDMSALDEVFFAPYADYCVLDDDGYPINITSGYVNSIFVDSFWYDPIEGNPTNVTIFNNALYLQHVFYFNQPMTMSFVAELRCNGETVDSRDVVLDESVIATCDFERDDISNFPAGSYSIALLFNGEVIVESSEVTVR